MEKRKINLGIILLLGIFFVFSINLVSATWCCEKTVDSNPSVAGNQPAWCQPMENEEDCDTTSGLSAVPISCEATAYCQLGTCIDNNEGTCTPNTPEKVCQEIGGFWDARLREDIPQCQLGCCLIGESAHSATQVRCEKMSADYDVEMDFRADIQDALECAALANPSEKGACVFSNENSQRDCEIMTREQCQSKQTTSTTTQSSPGLFQRLFGGGNQNPSLVASGAEFHPGFLCSAEELNTICRSDDQTICGDDGRVYFIDTCKQRANVYDSSKLTNPNYWTYMQEPDCTDGLGNKGSATCGDCDYHSGSTCSAKKVGENVVAGGFICRNLDCVGYVNADEGFKDGRYPKHEESWCAKSKGISIIKAIEQDTNSDGELETVFTGGDNVETDNLPGSRYFRKTCYDGEVIPYDCDQRRQEVCIEGDLDPAEDDEATGAGIYKYSYCHVNLWRDCTAQINSETCENMDERYCKWMDTGYYFDLEFGLMSKTETEETTNNNLIPNGVCVPKYSPGFDSESDDPLENGGMCAAANSVCIVTYEINALALKAKKVKSISELPLEERKTYCTHNCHCLEPDWQIKMNSMCSAIGDCGTKNNLISRPGEQSEVVVITAAPVEEAA